MKDVFKSVKEYGIIKFLFLLGLDISASSLAIVSAYFFKFIADSNFSADKRMILNQIIIFTLSLMIVSGIGVFSQIYNTIQAGIGSLNARRQYLSNFTDLANKDASQMNSSDAFLILQTEQWSDYNITSEFVVALKAVFYAIWYLGIVFTMSKIALIILIFASFLFALLSKYTINKNIHNWNTSVDYNPKLYSMINSIADDESRAEILFNEAMEFFSNRIIHISRILNYFNVQSINRSTKNNLYFSIYYNLGLLVVLISVIFAGESSNNLTSGNVILIITIFGSIAPQISQVGEAISNLSIFLSMRKRSLKNSHEDTFRKDLTTKSDVIGEIIISKLVIGNNQWAKDVDDFVFKTGDIVCLVGESGSGKTTLLKTLVGINKKRSGLIKYNDIEIDDMHSRDIYDRVSYMSQSPLRMMGTLKHNLSFGKPISSSTYAYADALSMTDIIRRSNNVFSGENGQFDGLSGRQWQRIALIRTLQSGKSILILDEPTLNLDQESVTALISILNEIKREKIIVISTHDVRLISQAASVINL